METPRYIIRIEDGELFGWFPDWLKIPGMVEYDPAKHGYRSEVAKVLGLPTTPVLQSALRIQVSEHVAGGELVIPSTAPAKPQSQPIELDLTDAFNVK